MASAKGIHASPKQIAWRKKFAKMVKSGNFKKAKTRSAKKIFLAKSYTKTELEKKMSSAKNNIERKYWRQLFLQKLR